MHTASSSAVNSTGSERRNDCGLCGLRPQCIQPAANIKVFVCLCCFLVALQQTLASGYLNSVLTTIEKRFDISSGLVGAIASTYEIGNLVTIIFVSYLGSRRHIPVWLGTGTIVMGIGSLVFVIPQFASGRYIMQDPINLNLTEQNMCKDKSILASAVESSADHPWCPKGESSNAVAVVIFMCAQLLIGSGGSPLFTLGTTYIDDHIKKESAAMYIGFLYSMVAFGPVCGFLLGGYLLSFYVDFLTVNSDDLSIRQDDPRWVGAWWAGFLIIGCLLLLVAVPVFTFPKRLKSYRKVTLVYEDSSISVNPSDNTPSDSLSSSYSKPSQSIERERYGSNIRDIPRSIFNLFYNPIFTVTCVGSCMELVILSGFAVFLPKYLETQFSISKSQANIFIGGIAIPGGCLGILIGGFVLKKFQLKPRGAIKLIIISNFLCVIMYCCLFFLGCKNVQMAGATVPYFTNQTGKFHVNLTAMCNEGCQCSTNGISPICGVNNISYFSPCFAGCSTRSLDSKYFQHYSDCKCIISNNRSDNIEALNDSCPKICHTVIPFMMMLFLMSLVVTVTQMPILMIVLRTVEEHERSFALGMQFVIYRLFGYIPSPIMFGNVIDSTCLLWSKRCSNNAVGFCLMYDIEKFRYYFLGICTAIKFVTGLVYCIDWILIRQMDKTATSLNVVDDAMYTATRTDNKDRQKYDLVGDGNSSDETFQSTYSKGHPLQTRPQTPGPKRKPKWKPKSKQQRTLSYDYEI